MAAMENISIPDGMSEISMTDLNLWKALHNPESVDLVKAKLELVREKIDSKARSPPTPPPPTPRVTIEQDLYDSPSTPLPDLHDARPPLLPRSYGSYVPPPQPSFYRPEPMTPRPRDSDEVRREKQAWLIEIEKLRRKGIMPSRQFTMDDDVADMEYECDSHNINEQTAKTVANIKKGLCTFWCALEVLNKKAGPFVFLDGWSSHMISEIDSFDAPVEKIYKMYFRRTAMNPFVEIAWLMLSSIVLWNAQHYLPDMISRMAKSKVQASSRAADESGAPNSALMGMLGNLMGMGLGAGPSVAPPSFYPSTPVRPRPTMEDPIVEFDD